MRNTTVKEQTRNLQKKKKERERKVVGISEEGEITEAMRTFQQRGCIKLYRKDKKFQSSYQFKQLSLVNSASQVLLLSKNFLQFLLSISLPFWAFDEIIIFK